jgi:hypothetical protein
MSSKIFYKVYLYVIYNNKNVVLTSNDFCAIRVIDYIIIINNKNIIRLFKKANLTYY